MITQLGGGQQQDSSDSSLDSNNPHYHNSTSTNHTKPHKSTLLDCHDFAFAKSRNDDYGTDCHKDTCGLSCDDTTKSDKAESQHYFIESQGDSADSANDSNAKNHSDSSTNIADSSTTLHKSPISFSPKIKRFAEPICFALRAKDTALRLKSSSGGAFSLISQVVLAQNGVVFGAGFDENLNVAHRFIEKQDELDSLRRSKYVESNLGTSYSQAQSFLKQGRLVLFSGVSCQIHGLHSFLKKPYPNLLTIEVICNSIPSSKIWDIYKESLAEDLGEKLVDFNFRGKDYGWENGVFAIKTKTKTKTQPHFKDTYFNNFLNHTITRKSCDNCYSKAFVSGSDITLGDFWGVRNYHSDFTDEKGVSCVLVHNQKGLDFIYALKDSALLIQTTLLNIIKGNPALIQSNKPHLKREQILSDFFDIYAKSGAKEAIAFLADSSHARRHSRIKSLLYHYYRIYKDDPIRRAISKRLKNLIKKDSL